MEHSITGLAPLLPTIIVAVIFLFVAWRRSPAGRRAGLLLIALFGAIALPTGIAQRMGEGVYYNAHFETLIATCLGFGLALSWVCGRDYSIRAISIGPSRLVVFAALPLICAWPWHLPRAWADIHDRNTQAAAWQPVIDRIAATDGPAGCLMMSLCWWAGKPSEIDVFNLTEGAVVGSSIAGFQAAVAQHHFAIIQDDPKSFTHDDAIRQIGYDPVMKEIAKSYSPILYGPEHTVLLMPTKAGH